MLNDAMSIRDAHTLALTLNAALAMTNTAAALVEGRGYSQSSPASGGTPA